MEVEPRDGNLERHNRVRGCSGTLYVLVSMKTKLSLLEH